jgi:hypothetical protein
MNARVVVSVVSKVMGMCMRRQSIFYRKLGLKIPVILWTMSYLLSELQSAVPDTKRHSKRMRTYKWSDEARGA